MSEIDGQQNGHWHGLAHGFRRLELQIARPFHGCRIERCEPGGFCDSSRLGYNRAVAIDENPERDVSLHLLRIQRGRVSKRELFIEHHRRKIRLSADGLKCRPGAFAFLAADDRHQQQNQRTPRELNSHAVPFSCLTSSTSRASVSSACRGVIWFGSRFFNRCTTGWGITPNKAS